MSDAQPKTPFWPADYDDAGLDPFQARALLHAWRVCGKPGGDLFQRNRKAAGTCRMSERQYRRAMKELVRLGWIRETEARNGVSTKYTVCVQGTAAPQTADYQAAAPQAREVGPTGRGTADYQADIQEGTPLKVLPEGTPLAAPVGRPLVLVPEIVKATRRTGNGKRRSEGNGHGRETWLTPYLEVWREVHPNGEPDPGKMARFLAPLDQKHGTEAVLAELGAYLRGTLPTYVSLPKFGECFGSWASRGGNSRNGVMEGVEACARVIARART